jgi:hypothetical protein
MITCLKTIFCEKNCKRVMSPLIPDSTFLFVLLISAPKVIFGEGEYTMFELRVLVLCVAIDPVNATSLSTGKAAKISS